MVKKEIKVEMTKEIVPEYVPTPAIPTPITKLSVDLGREDLNNLAIKINEVIDRLNLNG